MAAKIRRRSTCAIAALLLVAFFVVGVLSSPCPDPDRTAKEAKGTDGSSPPVKLSVKSDRAVMDNGIVRVTFSVPEGNVVGIEYGGIDNVLEFRIKPNGRGYWDAVLSGRSANRTGPSYTNYWAFVGEAFKVIKADANHTEISFTTFQHQLAIDRRFVMLRGGSGFYSYAVIKHERGSGHIDLGGIRAAFKLRQDKFNYMAVSDKIQRVMPTNCERRADHSSPLAYGEAVLINESCDKKMKSFEGEVDDKYMYSIENKDNKLHGWISENPPVGFWVMTPSNEFRSGGPFKQNLASHTGPTCLVGFYNDHYIGPDLLLRIEDGEEWKSVYGPFFVHLNSVPRGEDPHTLWGKAKDQLLEEEQNWPYDFPQSRDFVKQCQRGSVSGQLLVSDIFNGSAPFPASSAWIILAPPGDKGSWQLNTKYYQFWTQADTNGRFEIKGVVPGVYDLFASVPGVIDEYKHTSNVVVEAGSEIAMGSVVYEPPRNGPTLWEIGVPDRTAAEFFVPDPDMSMVNRLFLNDTENKYRQYGLWLQYPKLYPNNEDLVYNVVMSDYKKDWFYAHLATVVGQDESGKNIYAATTRQIQFPLDRVIPNSVYTLQIAVASCNYAALQVRVNDRYKYRPDFGTGMFGRDNAIARHGIHGLYRLFTVPIRSSSLYPGMNTIYLTQPRASSVFSALQYDYIRLEGPFQRENYFFSRSQVIGIPWLSLATISIMMFSFLNRCLI